MLGRQLAAFAIVSLGENRERAVAEQSNHDLCPNSLPAQYNQQRSGSNCHPTYTVDWFMLIGLTESQNQKTACRFTLHSEIPSIYMEAHICAFLSALCRIQDMPAVTIMSFKPKVEALQIPSGSLLDPLGDLLASWPFSREIPVRLPARRHILGSLPAF